MSDWEVEGKRTCTKCGRKWVIEYRPEIFRDSEELRCKCGEVIWSYNEAASYRITEVKAKPNEQ